MASELLADMSTPSDPAQSGAPAMGMREIECLWMPYLAKSLFGPFSNVHRRPVMGDIRYKVVANQIFPEPRSSRTAASLNCRDSLRSTARASCLPSPGGQPRCWNNAVRIV